jgi:hypothetical protein
MKIFSERKQMRTQVTEQMRPACWKVAPGVVWIQVHEPEQARALARIAGGRRVAYSVAGAYLRTFEFARSLRWAENWSCRQLTRQTGTNEAFSVLAGPEATRVPGRGCRQRTVAA